jgi:hypothetical protein
MYTPEIEKILVEEYIKKPDLETVAILAERFDKPEKSIISKLSNLGVYKRKVYVSKSGEPPIKKEAYIERIANLLDVEYSLLESLEKATKYSLVLMDKKIQELKDNNV